MKISESFDKIKAIFNKNESFHVEMWTKLFENYKTNVINDTNDSNTQS